MSDDIAQCSICRRWYRFGPIGCAVVHGRGACCHYGDVQVAPPQETTR